MAELHDLNLTELGAELKEKKVSPEEVVGHFQERVTKVNPELNAFLNTEAIFPGDLDPSLSALSGIPFAVKDNIVLEGQPAHAASKILDGFISPYTATVLQKLMAAGGVPLGRTNLDEYAMGSSTENSAFGPTKNPWDLARVPGGSSGGSAAAVAAGLVPYALGSDTGGSIRQPASFCGIVGVKPTYGRVSRYGLIALGSSLDCIGPFARTVEDAAIVLEHLAGLDKRDSTTQDQAVPNYSLATREEIRKVKVGVPKEFFGEGLQPEVGQTVKEAIKKMEELGAEIVEVSLPSAKFALAAYYIILPVEVSANLSRYDGVKYGLRAPAKNLQEQYLNTREQGFGAEPKRRIVLGTYASSSGYYDAYYKQALHAQNVLQNEIKNIFEKVDVLVTPTAPSTAFKMGEKVADPLAMYLNDVYAVVANIAGIPAMSLPCGQVEGLPVGMQIMAPWFDEATMFRVAGAYEKATEWHKLKPKIWTE